MQNIEAKLTKRDKQLHVPLEKNVDYKPDFALNIYGVT
jgi:hypothetical protein